MRWLTDAPERTTAFLPAGQGWHLLSRPGDAAEPAFWPGLAGARPAWYAAGHEATTTPYPDRPWVIIDEAERSQFTVLLEALKAGAVLPDGLACIALTGKQFHGQRQRAWSALRGNLHLTVYYRLSVDAGQAQAGLAMAPAVAVIHALERMSEGRLQPAIKWTNDILLYGKKVAGVLTSTLLEGAQIQHVLFGVGLNIDVAPALAPSAMTPPPGALADFDPALRGALPRLFPAVVDAMDEAVACVREGHSAQLFESYRTRAAFLGREVSIWAAAETDGPPATPLARGRVVELRPDLSLIITGCPEPVTTGRMVLE